MKYFDAIDHQATEFGDLYDELPLWSARFGLLLLERVNLRPGITILDVGAGTGFAAIELAQRCGGDAKVIAVDPWEAAIARLRRKLDHLGLDNVRTIAKPIEDAELPDASVDLIVSNLGINNFENPAVALQACFRAAKPGASLFLTTNLVGHMGEFYEAYRSTLLEMGIADRLAALDAHITSRATVESIRRLLEDHGFQFVEATTRTFAERFADGSALLNHFFVRLGFMPAWKTIAPEDALEATFAALERRLNALAAQRGELSLTVPGACVQAVKPPAP